MIKILHIVGLAHGGVGHHLHSLLDGCDPHRFESTVAMAVDHSALRPDFEKLGVRTIPLQLNHYGGLKANVAAFRQLAKLFKQEQFDVVQTHTSVAGAVGRIAAKTYTRTPVVHMIHAFAGHPYRSFMFRKTAALIERRLDRWTDYYIAGTRAMVERGVSQRIFKASKAVLIPNGIDLDQFDANFDRAAEQQRPTSDGVHPTVTVGFLGRLEQQKGVPYLVRAAAMVRQQNPHVRFRLAGDGKLRPELERLAAELQVSDVIEFVGWQRDAAAFLKQIDILAMPSLWEAFGLSAAEGMAAGKPVVASRVEGLPEVVEDGRTGILVPPTDHEALARAIIDLAADPDRRMVLGRQGRKRVEERFTLTRMISQHEELYERLAAGRHSRRAAAEALASPLTTEALSMAD